MKKIFYIFLALSLSIASKAQNSVSRLASDPTFVSALNEYTDIQIKICENFKNDSKLIAIAKDEIQSLTKHENTSVETIAKILKFNSVEDFENSKNLIAKWDELKTKYGNEFTLENINSAEKIVNESYSGKSRFRYAICCAGAMAVGVVTMTGCTGGTFGLGAPVCAALAIVIQTAIIQDCANDYLGN